MSVPVATKPDVAEVLAPQARVQRLSTGDYLRDLLLRTIGKVDEVPLYESASPEEWVAAFREWAASHPLLQSTADDSRESIYLGAVNERYPGGVGRP